MMGEGISLFGAIAAMLIALAVSVEGLAWLLREWPNMVDEATTNDEEPKSAGQGRCRCAACRGRPQEPCSDYDGD